MTVRKSPTQSALREVMSKLKRCTPGSILLVTLHPQHKQAPFCVKVEWMEVVDGQMALGVFTHSSGKWFYGRSILVVPSMEVLHYLIPYYDEWDKKHLDVHHVWRCVEKIETFYVQS